ncbi:hypothetical protein Mapa_007996 [Marchantia paleacea]|nr:hypothetical protein Mapa_007996 [Marchantia paleacea]
MNRITKLTVMSQRNGRWRTSLTTGTKFHQKPGNREKTLFSGGPSDKNLPTIQIVSSPMIQVTRWKVLLSNYGTSFGFVNKLKKPAP